MRRAIVLLVSAWVLATTNAASGALLLSLRVNPIASNAILADPTLANAVSVSVMAELTAGSSIGRLCMDFTSTADFYRPVDPPLLPGSDPSDEFMTRVFGTILGSCSGSGPVRTGQDRRFDVESDFSMSGTGLIQLARLTWLGVNTTGFNERAVIGFVSDGNNPSVRVPLSLPFVVPEPTGATVGSLLGVLALGRWRRLAGRGDGSFS